MTKQEQVWKLGGRKELLQVTNKGWLEKEINAYLLKSELIVVLV